MKDLWINGRRMPNPVSLTFELESSERPQPSPGTVTIPIKFLAEQNGAWRKFQYWMTWTPRRDLLRAQARRKGKPGWRHWKGIGRESRK